MRYQQVIVAVCVIFAGSSDGLANGCNASPPLGSTHFWLSPLAEGAEFAETPLINVVGDSTLYIWGRPTDDATIHSLSLNLVSAPAGIVEFTDVTVDNPALGLLLGKPAFRYEFTKRPDTLEPDRVLSIQGFTVAQQDRRGRGIGPATQGLDPLYDAESDAWRIAEVSFHVSPGDAPTSQFLQIGTNGIFGASSEGQSTSDFAVVFGDVLDPPLCTIDEKGTSSIFEDALITGGRYETEPDDSLGGSYWQGSGALLTMDIDARNMHDRLDTHGTAHLDGELELIVNGLGYNDPIEEGALDRFELIQASTGVQGVFDQVTYDGTVLVPHFFAADEESFRSHQGQGLFRGVTYEPQSVELSNLRAVSGDVDGNMRVEFEDFLVLTANFFQAGDWTDGDFDQNGTVDFADFLLLSDNFENAVRAVPEPSTVTLVLLGAALSALSHRRSYRMGKARPM